MPQKILKNIQEATTDYQICERFLEKDDIKIAYNEILDINIRKIKNAYYFPKIKEIISILYTENYLLFIFSGRDNNSLIYSLKKEKLIIYFNEIIGGDSFFSPKPNHDAIRYIIDKYNLFLNNVLYIGDSETDYLMSKKIGCNFIAAKWYNNKQPLKENDCFDLNNLLSDIHKILD